jgi:hypothetical protein
VEKERKVVGEFVAGEKERKVVGEFVVEKE